MTNKSFSEILEDVTEQCRMMDAPLAEQLKAVVDEVRRLSPEFTEIVDRMVARLEANSVNETWMLPIPATFIIGRDGVVKARFVDPDYRKRMDLCPPT